MPSRCERRRHANVGHEHVGLRSPCARYGLVVVGRVPTTREIRVPRDEGTHALAHDEVVVGKEDVDRPRRNRRRAAHDTPSSRTTGVTAPGGGPPGQRGVRTTPRVRATPFSLRSRWRIIWLHAIRELCHLAVMDPLRSGSWQHAPAFRRRSGPLRPTTPRRSRRPRRIRGKPTASASPTASRPGWRWTGLERSQTPATAAVARSGARRCASAA